MLPGLHGKSGFCRHLQTLTDHGIGIFALQETRVKIARHLKDPRYILISSAATEQGRFDMLIGLSKIHAHGWVGDEPVYFTDDDYAIIVARPRLLILRVRTRALKCILINAHAPHTGASQADIDQFWQEVSSSIPNCYDAWPKLILTDANCRLGGQPDGRIGDWQSEGPTIR